MATEMAVVQVSKFYMFLFSCNSMVKSQFSTGAVKALRVKSFLARTLSAGTVLPCLRYHTTPREIIILVETTG